MASAGGIVASLATSKTLTSKRDPYAVPPELLALLTGKNPAAKRETSFDVISRVAAGSKWDFRGHRVMKVFEDETATAWIDPEGWTDCVVFVAAKAMPGLQGVFLDMMPDGAMAGVGAALQHVSRGVRLGASELWGIAHTDVGISVCMSCSAPAGGMFPRPVFVVTPRRVSDSHFRSASAALAMGAGKGDARMLRRRLLDPTPLVQLPMALPAAQGAAVLLFATSPASHGCARIRIMQFDSAGKVRCLDNRCARAAGLHAKVPMNGPAMAGATPASHGATTGGNQEWEARLVDLTGERSKTALAASANARQSVLVALLEETRRMKRTDRAAVFAQHGITEAEAAKAESGTANDLSTSASKPSTSSAVGTEARAKARAGIAGAGMGPPSQWPGPKSAACMVVTLRNPKTGLWLVAEGAPHGFVLPGARVRLVRTTPAHGKEAALMLHIVPAIAIAPHLAGGVHLRVPFLTEGEPGGGRLLESHMNAPGAQAPFLRLAACKGAGKEGDEATPDQLASAAGAVAVAGDISQRWLYLTADSIPPAKASASVPSELTLQPLRADPGADSTEGHSDVPGAAGSVGCGAHSGREAQLRHQIFFLAPYRFPMHDAVVPVVAEAPTRDALTSALATKPRAEERERKAAAAVKATAAYASRGEAAIRFVGNLTLPKPLPTPPSRMHPAAKGMRPEVALGGDKRL